MTTITVNLPDQLGRKLEALSQSKHQPVDELVQDSIRRYVALEELHALRAELRPYAEKAGYNNEEDILGMSS